MSSSANTFQKYRDFPNILGVHKVVKLLENAEPFQVLQKFAETYPMPKNSGAMISWRRIKPFAATTTELFEGVTPPPQAIQYEIVTQYLGQFGAWVQVSDRTEDLNEDAVLDEAMEELGKQAAQVKEQLLWGTISGGTQVIYANGTGRTDVNTPLSADLVADAVQQLKLNYTPPITTMLAASVKIGTEPVRGGQVGGYVGVGPQQFERDIREMDGFIPVEKYASGSPLHELEIGAAQGVRFILSPDYAILPDAGSATLNGMQSTNGDAVDVGQLVIFGRQFYGDVPLKGATAVEMKYLPAEMTKDDPLGQRAAVAWKMYYACVRLNERRGIRIEAGITDPFAAEEGGG